MAAGTLSGGSACGGIGSDGAGAAASGRFSPGTDTRGVRLDLPSIDNPLAAASSFVALHAFLSSAAAVAQ
jgi:hypothetical protein